MKRLLYLLAVLLVFFSCSEDVDWTTDPSVSLSFSADTIAFDTLISTVPSSTKTLAIYNRNKKGVRLSRAYLQRGGQSYFRVNVDGQYLVDGQGEDFQIPHRDSIVVRLEVTLPETGQDGPVGFEDNLVFQLESGVLQTVHLTAGAQDAIMLRGLVVVQDTVFSSPKPIVVFDSLVVAEGARLTLESGTRLLFHDGAGLEVHGQVEALGTLEAPVIFRGDRTDHLFPYLPYDNTPSRWEGIRLYGSSLGNTFRDADIHSACYGIICDSTDLSSPSLLLQNSVIHNIGGDGLRVENSIVEVENTQISNTLGRCVSVYGGGCRFLHTTIAQFYPFDANRGDALYLANQDGEASRDLLYAHFINCVITGYGDDVIMGNITEGQDYPCDYLFRNCYLNTVVSTDTARFSHVIYDNDEQPLQREQNFRLIDTHNFLYDLTPDSLSSIRNLASPDLLETLPTDRLGRSRTADEAPDAGCYEYLAP